MTRAETAEFADFYAAAYHRVAAQLYAYLGDHAEAQDLAQEAFTRALDRWSRVSAYENPDAWVRRVAWNLATSRLRHLQVVKRFVAGHREEPVPPPGPERVDLSRALAALPANHRLAVVLHHLGHLSTLEIAEQCGVAEGTVRSWLSRGRTQLAEQLIDWERVVVPAPEGGAEAAVAKVKRRRAARRTVMAAVLAVLVAVPLTMLLITRGTEPPIIEPTPLPSHSPSPTTALETRRVSLPGLGVRMYEISFVDRDNAWLWHDPCVRVTGSPPSCRTLATTADGGRTWKLIQPPSMPDKARAVLLGFDANTATLEVTEYLAEKPSNYLHTKDGGLTWTSHPVGRPPAEAVLARGGRYRMLCPGATGLEGHGWESFCEQAELVRIGSGPTAVQPPLRTRETKVFEGGDGRLWLLDEGRSDKLFLSEDAARTWRQLSWPAEGVVASMRLSPDGRHVWALAVNSLGEIWTWELVGSQWVKRDLEVDRFAVPMLLDDGIWLVSRGGAMGYLKNGVFTAVPGSVTRDGAGGRWLRDGTVILASADEVYLGTGPGMRREWVRITS